MLPAAMKFAASSESVSKKAPEASASGLFLFPHAETRENLIGDILPDRPAGEFAVEDLLY